MLGYLQGTSRPDIAMVTHQCARFCSSPKLSHESAAKRTVRYLLQSRDKGIIFRPDLSKGLECFVDVDFAGGWKDGDHESPKSVLSRTGYVIMFAVESSLRRGEATHLVLVNGLWKRRILHSGCAWDHSL